MPSLTTTTTTTTTATATATAAATATAISTTTAHNIDDPLTRALAPPPDESPGEAQARISAERAAARHSDEIDSQLRQDGIAAKRRRCVKILLLGQSESGKSTVLKNFQRKYDPKAFDRERAIWRSVCHLNIVRSFGIILDILHAAFDDPHLTAPLTSSHRRTAMRLAPLRQIEDGLTRRFHPAKFARADEVAINGWVWQRVRAKQAEGYTKLVEKEEEDLAHVLVACREDMQALWADPVVRDLLRDHRVGLEGLSGFFLDDLARIAVPHYQPTDDDILRARLKTVGLTEHLFSLRGSDAEIPASASEICIYDVGGSRSQRHMWMPFFDDVNAIVFLAPMSAFDQTLAEAPEVNRLEDTYHLWKSICSSSILARIPLVLLLNKRDVLQHKMEAGIRFGRYVRSYKGPEEWEGVVKYLRTKFKAVQREMSPRPRSFYAHVTCATDTKQMAVILGAIEELVLRRNLEDIKLL